ncbi:MAG: undecaprenyldiphospho-muramoylpentapeptide beta-N-acetylglucosaminyltransferase [Pseudomonadota bacterium]
MQDADQSGPTAVLSAGGTGGHLFPAQSLAQELKKRGWKVHLATDPRAQRFVGEFPADSVHIIPSATFAGKSPVALARTGYRLLSGYRKSRQLLKRLKPQVVVGFGGYPTVPPLLAATHLKLPTVLHEQNAVIGRANRFLASRVSAIATGFDLVRKDGDAAFISKLTVTGNPLRQVAHDAATIPFQQLGQGEPFKLLVFGGSQGARFFSQVVPAALALATPETLDRLHLTLQARPEDLEATKTALAKIGSAAEVAPFFDNLPHHIAQSHLVVCRSGASSVSELALIGRPGIFVPLPGSLDDDQGANAARIAELGGGQLVRQADLTPQHLHKLITEAMNDPQALALQAENAKKAGVPDAARQLADLVEAQI